MEKSAMTKIGAVIVVLIIVAAAAVIMMGNDGSDERRTVEIESALMLRGNANNDYTIDQSDMDLLEEVISGERTLEDCPLADVDDDGKVDETDRRILQDMIDRKADTTLYVMTMDSHQNAATVKVQYPLRNIVSFGTNIEMPCIYAGGGAYIAGYFSKSYSAAEASISSAAVNLHGSGRTITDATWANFTKLAADIKDQGGMGAFLVDYSAISQITDSRVADLNDAGIPTLIYESADSVVEAATVLTLSYLFGTETEKTGLQYAALMDSVKSQIDGKIGDLSDDERTSYIAFNMNIYIAGPMSTFASTGKTAGGIYYSEVNADFKEKYGGETNSSKMQSVEALSNYSDVGKLINIRSIDWQVTQEDIDAAIITSWEKEVGGAPTYEYFKGFEDRLVYINNLLPGAAKLAYHAVALYGDLFSYEWADGILQQCIDMGLVPLQGFDIEQLVPYFDKAVYEAAKA